MEQKLGRCFPKTLSGALEWQGAKHIPYGRHTLTFLAYDKENNISQASVLIYHAKPGSKHGTAAGRSKGKRTRRSSNVHWLRHKRR